MLQNLIQLRKESDLKNNSLRYFLKFLFNNLNNMEINKPLYSFTLPGLILGAIGLYMSFNYVEDFYLDGSSDLENTFLIALLTLGGIIMALTGILLHSIAGLIRYKANEL